MPTNWMAPYIDQLNFHFITSPAAMFYDKFNTIKFYVNRLEDRDESSKFV